MPQKSNLYFIPWRGSNYEMNNEKLLLLGESHYDKLDNVSENFTIDIVNEFLDWAKYKYFTNTGLLFNKVDSREIWNNISFSNVIQTAFPDGKTQPTQADISTIPRNFDSLLNILKPTKVIVLSKRLWEWLPEKNGTQIDSIKAGKRHSTLWKYNYENGACLSIGTCHPSWMFGKNGTIDEWSLLVKKFIAYSK